MPTLPESALRAKIDQAAEAAVSRPAARQEKAEPQALAEAFKPAENTAVSVLRDGAEGDIIPPSTVAAGGGVKYLCKLDKAIYSCISDEMVSDEIIITERQTARSNRHDNVFNKYAHYYPATLMEPDYIFEDSEPDQNPNTGVVTKRIQGEDGKVLQIVLRVKTPSDPEEYKNSVISSWVIGEKRLQGYLRNRKILYKREGI